MGMEYWVPGRPSTFATNHEALWRETIIKQLGDKCNIHNSIEMEFRISRDNLIKYAFDIDNLCEPVFSSITTYLGWYNSKRSNIERWKAIKTESAIEGMQLKDVEEIDLSMERHKMIFDGVYQGRFPNKATDPEIPEWLKSQDNFAKIKDNCAISLKFGSKSLSIATISSGKVKPVIDCLYPILGGARSVPDDHKITELYVEKSVEGLSDDQIRISIWERDN